MCLPWAYVVGAVDRQQENWHVGEIYQRKKEKDYKSGWAGEVEMGGVQAKEE